MTRDHRITIQLRWIYITRCIDPVSTNNVRNKLPLDCLHPVSHSHHYPRCGHWDGMMRINGVNSGHFGGVQISLDTWKSKQS